MDYTGTATTLDQVNYTYDYAGNRLTRDIPTSVYATNDKDQAYTYDSLQRLKTFESGTLAGTSISGTPASEQDWTLDQMGNWGNFVMKASGTTTLDQDRYHNDVNEIEGNGGNSITATVGTNWADPAYDAAGNATTMPQPLAPSSSFTLKYDAWNRMVEVKDGSTVVQTNEFDGLNRRIQKVVGSDTYDYYYNDQWQVLEIRKNGSGNPWKQYAYHPDYVDAIAVRFYDENTDGAGVVAHYYLQDANFNVTAVADDSGAVVERYTYNPYGEVTFLASNFSPLASTAIANELLYTGRRRDPETGLQLNRNRFYHQQLGRWTSQDPIGYEGGSFNLYEYVEGRPTYFYDPLGLLSCEEKCGLVAAGCTATCTALAVNHALHCHALIWSPPLYTACQISAATDLIACSYACTVGTALCLETCDDECPPQEPPTKWPEDWPIPPVYDPFEPPKPIDVTPKPEYPQLRPGR